MGVKSQEGMIAGEGVLILAVYKQPKPLIRHKAGGRQVFSACHLA